MADLALRINKDVLVLSGSVSNAMSANSDFTHKDMALANVLEPETVKSALAPFVACGTHCLIANTKDLLQSRLAKLNLDDKLPEIAKASFEIANSLKPQHVVAQLSNTGLPLDPNSKQSLNEVKNQFVNSARVFEELSNKSSCLFDAYFLTDIVNIVELKCALMGLRQVTDKPIILEYECKTEMDLNNRPESDQNNQACATDRISIYDVTAVASEFGVSVIGASVYEDADEAVKIVKRLRAGCDLPILIDFKVELEEGPYQHSSSMREAAEKVCNAGAHFLRASGKATPAYSAVLSAISVGLGK